jgi:hypothetical protein
MNFGVENFHPLEFSEMSPTLQSLEQELSKILREDNPTPVSSSNQITQGTRNSQGEEVKSFTSSHIEPSWIAIEHLTPPMNHFYNVSPTIMKLGVENFHPLEFSEMSPTLQSLEQELSKILREGGILSFY